MIITRDASKGQLIPLRFSQAAVAASQTAVALNATEVVSAASLDVIGVTMPFAGEIVAISHNLSAAGTAGVFTITVTVDTVAESATVVTVGTTTDVATKIQRGAATFVVSVDIGVDITTDGDWDGTTSDLLVTVWVLVQLEGI